MEAFICAAPVPSQNYTSCTFNSFTKDSENSSPQPQKKRRVYVNKSDDEDWTLKLNCLSDFLNFLDETCLSFDTLDWVFDTWSQSLSVLHTKWVIKAFPVPLFITIRLSIAPIKYLNWPSPVSNERCALVRFWNHAYDFSPNCTPLSSITIINLTHLIISIYYSGIWFW